MMLFPVSTEVHDGRMRLGAVQIMAACVMVHLFVSGDSLRFEQRANQLVEQFRQRAWQSRVDTLVATQRGARDILERGVATQARIQQEFNEAIRRLLGQTWMFRLGLKPNNLSITSLFTYMFVHSGWMHLVGNLLFFYVCGVAMEKYWGFWRFMGAYLGCGVFAALFYAGTMLLAPAEARQTPLVGASGAIAGAMGAMVVTHAKVRVKVFYLVPFWRYGTFMIPSFVYFGLWFLAQIGSTLLAPAHGSGVAYAAHIGGFMMGAMLGWIIKSEDEAALVVPAGVMRRMARNTAVQRAVVPESVQRDAAFESGGGYYGSLVDAGWEAYSEGDVARAANLLGRAIEHFMQAGEQRREELTEVLTRALNAGSVLGFPALRIYHWGEKAARQGMEQLALRCYDTAADTADTPRLLKNALIAAASLRLHTGSEFDKARVDLARVITLDNDGLFAREARRLLALPGWYM
jgi:membrane associated rhomboid family serine protease